MAAERYLSRRIPDLRVGNNIDEIDKKLIPASIHPCTRVCASSQGGTAVTLRHMSFTRRHYSYTQVYILSLGGTSVTQEYVHNLQEALK